MPQVEVAINGRDYQVACGDGEEEHVGRLLNMISGQVDQLAKDVGQVGQSKLMLFAALVMADEMDEMRIYVEALNKRLEKAEAGGSAKVSIEAEDIAEISKMISRIDAVAEQVQKA